MASAPPIYLPEPPSFLYESNINVGGSVKQFFFFLSLVSLSTTTSAEAWHRFRPHFPPLVTIVDYQCPAGVGWMKMTLIRPNGTKGYRTWYLGSVANCERQQDVLQKHRVEIRQRKFIAICSPGYSYLNLYAIDPRGVFTQQSQTYYGELDTCLVHADEVNTR